MQYHYGMRSQKLYHTITPYVQAAGFDHGAPFRDGRDKLLKASHMPRAETGPFWVLAQGCHARTISEREPREDHAL